MRICQVVASWDNGGLEKHVIELSNRLSETHDVIVIVHPLMQDRFAPTVKVVAVDFSMSRWSPRLYSHLLTALKDARPEVIHAQANKAALLVGRLRRWLPAGIRYVATLHNQKGDTAMFESFDQVIAVSASIASLIKKAPVSVIYNGITPVADARPDRAMLAARFELDPAKPVWLAVGRLVEAKGFDVLVAAAAQAQVQAVIVGDGPLRAALEQQIQTAGASVVLAGFCPDAPALIAAADGLVISSRHEGGPYTLPEALLARVPVISTDVGMVREFLPEECIVPVSNVCALAQKLMWANQFLPDYMDKIALAFRRAESELTLASMCQRHNTVYQELV